MSDFFLKADYLVGCRQYRKHSPTDCYTEVTPTLIPQPNNPEAVSKLSVLIWESKYRICNEDFDVWCNRVNGAI